MTDLLEGPMPIPPPLPPTAPNGEDSPLARARWGPRICLVFTLAGLAMAIAPSPLAFDLDVAAGGGALVAFGGLLFLGGGSGWLIMRSRARTAARMLAGQDVLAHWTLDPASRQELLQEEADSPTMARVAGCVLGGIFVLIGLVVYLTSGREHLELFAAIMGAIGLFFAAIGFLTAAIQKRKLDSWQGEAIITPRGVWLLNQLHDWNGTTSRLRSVFLDEKTGRHLHFVYEVMARNARFHRHQVVVPVPPGREGEAIALTSWFHLPLSPEDRREMAEE